MNVKIKEMTLSDLNSIKDIINSEFDNFWNYNILKEELESKNSNYIIALDDNNKILGFAGIKVVLDEADIMNIVVNKNFRNNGIGTLLLKNIIQICESLNFTYINLEVNEENSIAIHLYENFGFEKLGLRKNYYKDKNGIIMKKDLKKI